MFHENVPQDLTRHSLLNHQTPTMAPEHNFFFWNYPENANRIPANFDRALAMQIFRQGRMYEQLKQAEAKNRKSKK
jgi:hypothetical protein